MTPYFNIEPPCTTAAACEHIWQMSGVARSPQQVRMFLKLHGPKFLKCGQVPAKADSEKQHQWVDEKLTPAIAAAQKGEIHLFFLDAAHFILGSFICYLWCAFRRLLKTGSGRNRINVLGAVHAISKKVVTLTNTTYITADTLIEFLGRRKKQYRDKPIQILLDNARYQHCAAVIEAAEKAGIVLLFLPPCSLNIIERLWKFTKKKILYAKYYDSPKAFHQAVETFFKNSNKKHKKELFSLLTLKCQFFDQGKT